MSLKYEHDRVRPSFLNSRVLPVIDVPRHPAYPSGHATEYHVLAYILSDLRPDRRIEFFRRAREIAVDREIAGVHYPSDSIAGMRLARKIVSDLNKNPDFVKMLEEARSEWTHAQ